MNRGFHVRPVEIYRVDLYLGKCATEAHEFSAKTLRVELRSDDDSREAQDVPEHGRLEYGERRRIGK